MEVFKKVCRHCYKDYATKRKQQRYCGQICAYRGKNKLAFNHYYAAKEKHAELLSNESMDIRRSKPYMEYGGLYLDRERYSE